MKDITSLLSEFSSMWSSSLGNITTVKHHVLLKPDSRPAFQNLYRAGLKTSEYKDQEIDWMLKRGVMDQKCGNEQALWCLL